jgi:DNA modification methylase
MKQGWFCPDCIIWHKKNPIPNTASQLTNAFEYLFLLTKIPTYNFRDKKRQYIHNVWNLSIGRGVDIHSAVFPNELPSQCIKLFTKENDIVMDNFCGLGTTLIEVKKLKRKGIGIEISKEYCDIAVQRLKNTTPNLPNLL